MSSQPTPSILAGPGIMIISALLFGYFGFGMSWAHRHTTQTPPQLLPMVVVLMWTLRIATVVFVVSAVLTFVNARAGNILYALVGLLAAVAFLVVAGWDVRSPYSSGVQPFLLVIFAAWNGYGSWSSLRSMLRPRGDDRPGGRDPEAA